MPLTIPAPNCNRERKCPLTLVLSPEQKDYIELYRKSQGLRSMAEAARQLLYLGSLATAEA